MTRLSSMLLVVLCLMPMYPWGSEAQTNYTSHTKFQPSAGNSTKTSVDQGEPTNQTNLSSVTTRSIDDNSTATSYYLLNSNSSTPSTDKQIFGSYKETGKSRNSSFPLDLKASESGKMTVTSDSLSGYNEGQSIDGGRTKESTMPLPDPFSKFREKEVKAANPSSFFDGYGYYLRRLVAKENIQEN